MKFEPKNKRLHVRRVGHDSATKKQKRDDGIIVPDKVNPAKKGNELYSILAISEDVQLSWKIGDYILVENNMVQKDSFSTEEEGEEFIFYTIQENYVKGIVSSWEEKE